MYVSYVTTDMFTCQRGIVHRKGELGKHDDELLLGNLIFNDGLSLFRFHLNDVVGFVYVRL